MRSIVSPTMFVGIDYQSRLTSCGVIRAMKGTTRTYLLRARKAVDLVKKDDGAPVGAWSLASVIWLFIRGEWLGSDMGL